MSRELVVRARVAPRTQPPYDRLFDPLVDDLVRGGERSRERFATRWSDTAALATLAAAKRRPLPATLAQSMREWHVARGAGPQSLAHLDQLARGEAVCVVAGQQPAPLGAPLYSLHKVASAVGLARLVTERTGIPCVPLYWMHGEDSDFAEIRGATFATRALELRDVAMAPESHAEGAVVGSVPVASLIAVESEGLAGWEGLEGVGDARRLIEAATARAADLGEANSALMLGLFAEQGLVVAEPRLPAFRHEARAVIDRYLAKAEELSAAARAAGEWLEREFGRRPLSDASLESFVFALHGSVRAKITPADARASGGATLIPSVALRPVVQDGVFPTVAMACGSAEISYLAQLREVFEGIGVRAACPVPRLGATWLPPAATELLDASGVAAWELVTSSDKAVRECAERAVPEALRAEIESVRAGAFEGLAKFAASSTSIDASLPQLVESARGKIDFQFSRLTEALTAKARHRLERQHPEWTRVRYYLLPGDRLQERRLCSLEPVARRGADVIGSLCEHAAEHALRLAGGVHEHLVLEV